MNDLQRTDAWFQSRLGKLTGSRYADATARVKSGWGASRANYRTQLVMERMRRKRKETYQSPAMLQGIEREPAAVTSYEMMKNLTVTPVGFVDHPTIPMAGSSPDGLIVALDRRAVGIVSIKCPEATQHLAWLTGEEVIPGNYKKQMFWEMACVPTAQWCDFVSYCPEEFFDEEGHCLEQERLEMFVERVPRDNEIIAAMEALGSEFLREVDDLHKRLINIASGRRDDTTLNQLKASKEALRA